MRNIVFTADDEFFSTSKEKVVEKQSNRLIDELIKKSSTVYSYLEEGNEVNCFNTKVEISIEDFMDTYNKIMSIEVKAFEEIE